MKEGSETRETMPVGRNLAFIDMWLRQASVPKSFVCKEIFFIKMNFLYTFEAGVHPEFLLRDADPEAIYIL